MGIYTIIRVYEMPAESMQQATERMTEAIVLHVERDFHVKDYSVSLGKKRVKAGRLIYGLLQDGLSLL